MKKKVLTICVLSLIFFFAFASGYSQITFTTNSWKETLEQAKKEHKVIFVDLYAVWCAPCKAMAKKVFTEPKVGDFYNKSFINIKLDGEKEGAKLYEKYNVQSYPTYLFIDGDGKLVHKIEGAVTAAQFIEEGEKAKSL